MSTTLETQLVAFASQVGVDVGTLVKEIGALTNLSTTNKTSIVNAINELQGKIAGLATSTINDVSTGALDSTYSSQKINTLLASLKSDILDGAPAAYDTLKEIAAAITNNNTVEAALTNSIANKVDYSTAQTLTTAQQQQACANIGLGNPFVDLLSSYTTAKTTAST